MVRGERPGTPGVAASQANLGYPGAGTWATPVADPQTNGGLAILTSIVLALVAIAFFAGLTYFAQGYTYSSWPGMIISDYDEAAYVISAQLLDHGYHLFSQVFSSQPAGFLAALWAGIHLLRGSVDAMVAGHLVIGFFGALALLGTAWSAWACFGKWAAVAAAVVLGLTPAFILFSHTIEAEVPMLGVSMLAVAAASWYYRTHNRGLLILAGLLVAGGLEMKVLAAIFIVPIGLFVLLAPFSRTAGSSQAWSSATPTGGFADPLSSGQGGGRLIVDIPLFVLSVVVPLAIVLGLFSPRDQWDQVVAFHLKASSVYPLSRSLNVQALRDILLWDPGLLAAAAIGVLCALVRPSLSGVIHLLWFLATFAFLVEYHPLITHQFVVLFPPLAILAGGAIGGLAAEHSRALLIPLGLLALVAWIGLRTAELPVVPDTLTASGPVAAPAQTASMSTWDRMQRLFIAVDPSRGGPLALYTARMLTDTTNTSDCAATAGAARQDLHLSVDLYRSLLRQCLAVWVGQHTTAQQMIVTDDLFVATIANRLVPPELCDPSLVRASAGYLTEKQLETDTLSPHVELVVIWRGAFLNHQFYPHYVSWLRRYFKPVSTGVPGSLAFQRL